MDDPNITMEEYIRLEEEKARRRVGYFNDFDYFKDFEKEFLAIAYNNALTSKLDFSEPTKNTPYLKNLKNSRPMPDFEEYAVKMDDPNSTMEEYIRLEEEKARRRGKVYNWETATYGKIWCNGDVHDLRSVETEFPAILYNDALTSEDYTKEFPAIAYNDALTSKLDFPEPTISPKHIDEFDKTSMSEYDGEKQNVIYFNDLFPFNVIYPNDLSDKDNNNAKIDIEQSLGDLSIEPLPTVIKVDAQW
ncbi:hypothetical protein Tco_1247157 [Tanacetum coccineum]